MSTTLTPGQRRTQVARQAFADTFSNPEEKSAHYRQIGAKGNAGRIVLSGDEAQELAGHAVALGDAYQLLASIAARAKTADPTPDDGAAPSTS